jgi:hypothetical protein
MKRHKKIIKAGARTKTSPEMDISDKLEERIREALIERAESVTLAQFKEKMKAIANGH